MSEPRIIKKYPNRRLYDTEVSRYVTLEDVRHLVLQEVPFQIRDARTNEDLTRSVLLQVIMEQEADGEPMFSEQVLSKIIRSYGDSLHGMMASYLERSLNLFVEQQARVQDQAVQRRMNPGAVRGNIVPMPGRRETSREPAASRRMRLHLRRVE